MALGDTGLVNDTVFPALARVLEDRNEELQVSAAYALRQIGPPAMAAVPALTKLRLSTDDNREARREVRRAAGAALRRINPIDSD